MGIHPFIFIRLAVFHNVRRLESGVLLSSMALCFPYELSTSEAPGWRDRMAAASDTHTTDRTLSDIEFEELLKKTWEMVQGQKRIHPLDQAAESPSWT
jgi:hypothetical protein